MTAEFTSNIRFDSTVGSDGSVLEVLRHRDITGSEEEVMEERMEDLRVAGRHVVDYQLTIDTQLSPPVYGWILHRKTTR